MIAENQRPKTKNPQAIDWSQVKRVLVVKLRSIGDTVLATPSLIALRRFLPDAQIDVLLEDWVVPVLDGFDIVDNVHFVPTKETIVLPGHHMGFSFAAPVARFLGKFGVPDPIHISGGSGPERKATRGDLFFVRAAVAGSLREEKYDVAFNLHGGTTATFFTAASRATHRVGLQSYQYSFLYNHLLSSPADFWHSRAIHSAEQQLALLGFVGVPVEDRPKPRLNVHEWGRTERVQKLSEGGEFALMHPASAFYTKQWDTENFARTAEFLAESGIETVAVASKSENAVLEHLRRESRVAISTFDDLTLYEVKSLASAARLFVGNDSGIAHIAAALNTPTVVIFGSSNRTHWRPWTDGPNEIVYEEFACQPCAGYECKVYGHPRCILEVRSEKVFRAIERVLSG